MIMESVSCLLRDAMASTPFLIVVSIAYRFLLARSGSIGIKRVLLMTTLIVAPLILPLSMMWGGTASKWPVVNDGPIIVVAAHSYPRWIETVIRVYAAGVVGVFLFQLVGHIRSLILVAGAVRKATPWGTIMVSRRKNIVPFCWMGYVVTGCDVTDRSYGMILTHERIHASQRHWVDLLVAGLMVAVNWFNPASWWLLGELKRVHEFQADRGVLRSGADKYEYQMLLIRRAAPGLYRYVTHNFTGSVLRSRIEMMVTPPSSRIHWLRVAALSAAGMLSALTVAVSSPITEAMDDIRYAARSDTQSRSFAVPVDYGSQVIMVDGKEIDKEVMSRIDPKTIDHVTVSRTTDCTAIIMIELKK